MTGPLVSVITPTWKRHDLLMERCVPSVLAQTWPKVEHVVISDGSDRTLGMKLHGQFPQVVYGETGPRRQVGPTDYGSRARNVGVKLATGDLIAYLDDDNAYRPDHLRRLVQALVADPAADFAYSRMLTHPNENVIGASPPDYGQVDTSLIVHRADTLERFGWWPEPHEIPGDKHAPDWGVVSRWLDAGAQWVHVREVTVDYYFAGG